MWERRRVSKVRLTCHEIELRASSCKVTSANQNRGLAAVFAPVSVEVNHNVRLASEIGDLVVMSEV